MRLIQELKELLLAAKPFVKPEFTQPMAVIVVPESVRQELLHGIMAVTENSAADLQQAVLLKEVHRLETERFHEADSRVKKRPASRRASTPRREGTD